MTSRSPWTLASWAGCLCLFILIVRFGADAGVTWDEPMQARYGDLVLDWYRSGFSNQGAMTYENLRWYGGLFEAFAQWMTRWSPNGLFETRHVLVALVGLAGVVVTGLTAHRVAGPSAGFFAGALLSLTPAWVGHSLFNPKDVPFATATALVVYCSVRLATSKSPVRTADVIAVGVSVGLALAVRPSGFFVAAYPGIGVAARAWIAAGQTAQRRPPLRDAWTNLLRLVRAAPIVWVLMLAGWPWAQLAPFTRPFEGMLARFPWGGVVLFDGKMFQTRQLPLLYLPTWFAITMPEIYVIAFILGLCGVVTRRSSFDWRRAGGVVTIALAIVVPAAGVIVARPEFYDGLRHFLFVFPLLAALGGVAIAAFFQSRLPTIVRGAGATALAASAVLVVVDIVQLHPYEYVYFNRTFGGLPAAAGRYETDYWGESYKEGLAWVVAEGAPPGPVALRVASCTPNSDDQLTYYRNSWPAARARVVVTPAANADFFLAITRFNCHEREGEVIHTVARQGVPLLYVIRTRTP